MGYPVRDPLLLRSAIDPWPRKAGFFKSLDYGNIARMAGLLGLGYLAFKSLKMLVYGKASSAALDKARRLAR
jgi:hypothetical protein